MTFRRLFPLSAFGILAIAVAASSIGAWHLRAAHLDTRTRDLSAMARLLGRLPDAEFAKLPREPRVTLVDAEGRAVADSAEPAAAMENLRLRPEMIQAAGQGEGSSTHEVGGIEMTFVAVRRSDGRFVRVTAPADLPRAGPLVLSVAVCALVALLAAAIACRRIARRVEEPLSDVAGLLGNYGRGEFSHRASVRGAGSMGELVRAANTVGDTLRDRIVQAAKDREELRAILEGVAEGVIATNRQQKILLANRGAAQLLDFPGEDTGRALWEMVRDEQILKASSEVLENGQRRTFQTGPVQNRFLEVSVSPWPASGTPEGLVIIVHDTTESVRYQELRKEFVANVSHELRTPMTFIKGFVETLLDGAMSDPVKGPEYLRTIEKHVDQLTNLVTNLLELSRLERGPGLLRRQSVDLAALVRKTAESLAPAVDKKRQTLDIQVQDLDRVNGDPDYLERAIRNLLDNAVKYTPEQGIIRISARQEGVAAVVEVRDNGIGIPADDLPRVFERFYRVDKSRSREMGGTGLGLSIVKHVALAHDGTVDASSEVGKGSTFRLKIPTRVDE